MRDSESEEDDEEEASEQHLSRMSNLWAILAFLLIHAADGSIHEYNNQDFTKIANARYFFGGSEGIYGSEFLDVHPSSDTPLLKGNSFIRYAFRFLF